MPDISAMQQGEASGASSSKRKKKNKRKKGKSSTNRRQSFAIPDDEPPAHPSAGARDEGVAGSREWPFYKYGNGGNHSDTSLSSEVLLDHRYAYTFFVLPLAHHTDTEAAEITRR